MDATVHTPLGRKGTNNIDRFQIFRTKNVTQISQIPQILLQLGLLLTTTGVLLKTTQTTWTTLFASTEVKEVNEVKEVKGQ